MTIHSDHPFATPEPERDPARRLRGRLASGVGLWCSGSEQNRVGLTVSSMMLAAGEPSRALGLIDPDSDLGEVLVPGERFVVNLLTEQHRDLAGMFAGSDPAPGGPFRFATFEPSEWGPVLTDAAGWAGCRVEVVREVGWSLEVTAEVEEVSLAAEPTAPLVHYRGRWWRGQA